MSSQAPVDPASLARVLLVRPRFLGDLCLTLPVVEHLRRAAPRAEIDYLVEAPYAPLLAADPRLGQVLEAPRQAGAMATARLAARLARRRYDLVLDLFCNPRTALWTLATGARVRAGYAGKGIRSRAYNRLVRATATSAIVFHLETLEALGWAIDRTALPRLAVAESARALAAARLARAGLDAARLVVLHPGAAWPTRRWPPEHFVSLAAALLARAPVAGGPEVCLGVLAGPGEEDLAAAIVERVRSGRCRLLAGVPLEELPALLSLAAAFVGGDTGPLHVSVAVETPTVGLFGRNRPDAFFPYPIGRYRAAYAGVWCSPCHLDECAHLSCLWMLTPEGVLGALSQALEHALPAPAGVGP